MGQLRFEVGRQKKVALTKKMAANLPQRIQSGHTFTIIDGCVLKMETPKLSREVSEPASTEHLQKCIVAAFDMDQTLITTKSGLKFGRNGDDWKFLPQTVAVLRQKVHELQAAEPEKPIIVVIFTNQNGCLPKFSGKSLQYVLTKLSGISKSLPLFDFAFAAMRAPTPELKATYRKPAHGMFTLLGEELKKRGLRVDMEQSFYVGDAAGRPGDHSADDEGFAQNAGLKFMVPEEYFGDAQNPARTQTQQKPDDPNQN